MKLISMTDFVIEQNKIKQSTSEFKESIINYYKFLKKPITLGMFVPCDLEGNVLRKPTKPEHPYNDKECDIYAQYQMYLYRYKKAKERVLFKDCNCEKIERYYLIKDLVGNSIWLSWNESAKIEDKINRDLTLTLSAIKII